MLIGVATPGDLIKDTTRTPFNIGHRIDLTDFTLDEASPLVTHLSVPAPFGRELIASILLWTAGHPYLTLRAVRSLAESPPPEWTSAAVDQRIRDLFLRGGADSDSNLQFVRDMLTKKAFNREAVLRTYRSIRRGERVPDKELDQVASWLKLSGVVCRRDGVLRVRNAVYEHVFDEPWARDHLRLNVNWRRRLTGLAAVLLVLTVLVTIPLAVYAWRQKIEAEYQARQAELQRDDANRQRVIAENSLRDRLAALGTADRPLDELKRYNPSSAAAIEVQIASARAEAQKEFAALTTALRAERDDALRRLASANRALAARGGTAVESTGTTGSAGRSSPPPKSQEQGDIEKLLRMYEAAYWAKDVDALRRVQVLSSAEAKAIRTEFAEALQYKATVDKADIRVSADGRSATVTAEVRRIVTTGSRVSTVNSLKFFTLENRRNGWIIVSVR